MQLSHKNRRGQQYNRQHDNQLQNKILLHCSWFSSPFGDWESGSKTRHKVDLPVVFLSIEEIPTAWFRLRGSFKTP
jgi:hypothetical protein